ncbi:TIGR03086 family metal-binding protein [Streptomyces sp. NPDC005808]|uniref:TIGR03086 family metal-binding protein n=1 Tax=Streptomyces sp. NPDC005808 TaxID=3364734 RepID=UPI0036A0B3D4
MKETVSESGSPAARPSTDPRGGLFKAVALAPSVLAGIRPDQYDNATPCPDYSVRDLANHIVSVLRRVAVLGAGGSFMSVPHFADDIADGGWAAAWTESAKEFDAVWSDPQILGRNIALPWGPVPGAVASVIYTNEFVLHLWDIAKATGQSPQWDPEMLAAPLANMRRAVPAEPRGGQVPFGPVVEVHEEAPAIDRLVGWYGRRP